MREEKTSQFNKSHHGHGSKHYAVLPYILTPLVFLIIALIIALPVGKGLFGYAEKVVYKVKPQLSIDYNDIEPNSLGNENNSDVNNASIGIAQKMGSIVCENAGINTDVYYGLNRASFRQGAGIKKDALPGSGESVKVAGFRSNAFGNIDSLSQGDIITFETMWGSFDYEVYRIEVQAESNERKGDLVISTSADNEPFSSYKKEQLYVYASLVSGEVSQ